MFKLFQKKKKTMAIYAVATGKLVDLTEVPDEVFSKKFMGDGFAIVPSKGDVFSPIDAEVTSVFPTKHAIGLKTAEGLECLIHMGIDTVELKGEPFAVHVKEGDKVTQDTLVASIELDQLVDKGKSTDVIVVFPNYAEKIESMSVNTSKQVASKEKIGEVVWKK